MTLPDNDVSLATRGGQFARRIKNFWLLFHAGFGNTKQVVEKFVELFVCRRGRQGPTTGSGGGSGYFRHCIELEFELVKWGVCVCWTHRTESLCFYSRRAWCCGPVPWPGAQYEQALTRRFGRGYTSDCPLMVAEDYSISL